MMKAMHDMKNVTSDRMVGFNMFARIWDKMSVKIGVTAGYKNPLSEEHSLLF